MQPVVIVGAGVAGLAAAQRIQKKTRFPIIIIDREREPGGILRQCIHTGFGLERYNEELTGPEFLLRLFGEIDHTRVEFRYETTVLSFREGPFMDAVSSHYGRHVIKASAVIVATGSYERTRENMMIAGSRPAGGFTAGQAQQLINLHGYRIGMRVVVQGTGDIGLIMTRRLMLEGYEVAGVFERLPYVAGLLRNHVQCLKDFDFAPEFSTQITHIHGNGRVTGVSVVRLDESGKVLPHTERHVECDTVVLASGLIPNRELLSDREIHNDLSTTMKAVFIAGNAAEVHDLADSAAEQGEEAADSVIACLKKPDSNYRRIRPRELYQPRQRRVRWSVPAQDYLNTLGDEDVVCIVCPKGCILTQKNPRCRRGEEFLYQERLDKKRILTTTLWRTNDRGSVARFALRSRAALSLSTHRNFVRSCKSSRAGLTKEIGLTPISDIAESSEGRKA